MQISAHSVRGVDSATERECYLALVYTGKIENCCLNPLSNGSLRTTSGVYDVLLSKQFKKDGIRYDVFYFLDF